MVRRRLGVVLLVPEPAATEIQGLRRAVDDPALDSIPPHLTLVPPVNVREGLQNIRARLESNGAEDATLETVDLIMRRASLPAAAPASATSLLQLVRMLSRTPAANSNVRVYNDFVRLEEEMEAGAAAHRERQALEDAKPVPKTKKFYKEQKEREKKTG